MSTFAGSNPWWAAVVIIVVPIAIIAAAELDERLRQAESPFRAAVSILRTYALPAFAVWAISVPVLGVDADAFVPSAAASVLVVAITAALLRVLAIIVDTVRRRRRAADQPVPELLLALPRLVLIIAGAWILVGSVWGVDLTAALAALGVTSLVISFALQDTLSGLASGVLLLSDQPFQPGDWINTGDVEGKVLDINWRTTRIRDRNGDTIIVPNAQLAGANIVNFSSPENLHRVQVDLQVAYMNPPTLAKEMLLDAARGTPGVLEDPPPYVLVTQIDDPLMGYQVTMWIDDFAIEPQVKTDFGSLVWYQSHRHEVPLPSPAQDLYLYDGVKAGEADIPTVADIRAMLAKSSLLVSLDDAALDQLARAGRVERFAVGESVVDTRSATRDLIIVAEGRATLILADGDGNELPVAEVGAGESVGLLGGAPGEGRHLLSRAVTDCIVVVVDADTAQAVGSRHAEVAATFNRTAAIRRRRIERLLEQRAVDRATAREATE